MNGEQIYILKHANEMRFAGFLEPNFVIGFESLC